MTCPQWKRAWMSKAAKGTSRLDAPTFRTNMRKVTFRYLREDREEIGNAEGADAPKEEKRALFLLACCHVCEIFRLRACACSSTLHLRAEPRRAAGCLPCSRGAAAERRHAGALPEVCSEVLTRLNTVNVNRILGHLRRSRRVLACCRQWNVFPAAPWLLDVFKQVSRDEGSQSTPCRTPTSILQKFVLQYSTDTISASSSVIVLLRLVCNASRCVICGCRSSVVRIFRSSAQRDSFRLCAA